MRPSPSQPLALVLLALVLALGGSPALVAQSSRPGYASRLEALGFQVFKTPIAVKDFSLKPLGGGETKLSAFKGKIVVLNFWATWCPPCKEEMPSIQAFWQKTKGKALEVVAVSEGEAPSTVSSFVKSKGYTYPFYVDEAGSLGTMFSVQGIPTTFIFDKNGLAIARVVGGRSYDTPELIALLGELADAPASPAK